MQSPVKVAVVQESPVLFDKEATLEKIASLVREISKEQAHLIVFPEAFLPAYPRGLTFGTTVGQRSEKGRALWYRYWQNSLEIPSAEIDFLGELTKKANAYLSIGITEREKHGGTLYCTNVYFAPNGVLLHKHRKIKPTAAERIIWGEGDGTSLQVIETPIGKLGGLICWENYMPLARMALYQQGIELYIAPTADARESWQATLKHIALEGRCFVIGCNQFVTKKMYPEWLKEWETVATESEIMCRGGSAVIDPLGNYLVPPLFDETGILYATLSPESLIKSKFDFDVCGHYHRPDIFSFSLNSTER